MNTKLTIKLNTIERVRGFINNTTKFDSDIDVIRDRYVIDGKSIMALFTIDLLKPVDVKIHSNNEDEIIKFNKVMEEFL